MKMPTDLNRYRNTRDIRAWAVRSSNKLSSLDAQITTGGMGMLMLEVSVGNNVNQWNLPMEMLVNSRRFWREIIARDIKIMRKNLRAIAADTIDPSIQPRIKF